MTPRMTPPMTPAFEHNGLPVSQQDFYRLACDPRRHVVVEACAGAGKTWMLVSRIVRALLEGVSPQDILAITFTKKAAGEMRQRLMQWLADFACADDASLLGELQARGLDPASAPQLVQSLRQLQDLLLAQGRGVQIRTFHSWFAALLRTAPLSVLQELGLPFAYELIEQDASLIAQVWRPFQARLLQDSPACADYQSLVERYGRSQIEKGLLAALQRRVEFALADQAGVVALSVPMAGELYPEFAGLSSPAHCLHRPEVKQRWLDHARLLGQERNKTPQQAAEKIILALECLANTPESQVFEALRAALFVKDEDRLNHRLEKIAAAQAAEPELQRLCSAMQQHQAWLYQQQMATLSRLMHSEYAELKRARGFIDMNDIERAALHMLKDSELSGWLQERLDTRIRHLLIDEFQDTNPLQWQALHAWLSAYAGAGGGQEAPRLFIVGDPKQSIYRFRRAEPQVFLAAQSFVRQLGGELLSCDHTRRNAPAVLKLVNQVFERARDNQAYPGFRAHSTESQHSGQLLALPLIERADPQVRAEVTVWRDSLQTARHTAEETQRQLECRQAARWLAAQIAAGTPPGEIMVLSRVRERLAGLETELQALGIAANQPEKSDLGQAPEVQDLTALLDVLVSPTHDLSLARALRSPIFGLSDKDLMEIALRQKTLGTSWFEVLQQDWALPQLQAAGATLRRWQQWTASLPPHDALHAIYEEGKLLARYVASAPASLRARVAANLNALLSAALQVDGGRYATPYALVRALRAGGLMAPQTAVREAVQLLTVHGAKGLEASLVMLLDADAPAQRSQTMSVLLDWPGQDEQPRGFVFLASENRVPPSAQDAFRREQQERQREELNALYVAMTRAKTALVLSANQPQNANPLSWWQRLQPSCTTLSPAHLAAAQPQPQLQPGQLIRLAVLPGLQLTPDAPVRDQADTEDNPMARIGSAMHRLLEWTGLDAVGPDPTQLARVAAEFKLSPQHLTQAADGARAILTGEGRWAWQRAQLKWHGNEVPVSVQGRVGRIDRLVQTRDGAWWVLDYKLATQAHQQAELLAQLRGYRDCVQAAQPGARVRAAFLSASGSLEEIA